MHLLQPSPCTKSILCNQELAWPVRLLFPGEDLLKASSLLKELVLVQQNIPRKKWSLNQKNLSKWRIFGYGITLTHSPWSLTKIWHHSLSCLTLASAHDFVPRTSMRPSSLGVPAQSWKDWFDVPQPWTTPFPSGEVTWQIFGILQEILFKTKAWGKKTPGSHPKAFTLTKTSVVQCKHLSILEKGY